MGEEYDYVMVLQNTVPLRKSWHIDEAIEMIVDSNERSLISISEVDEHPILMRTLNEDKTVRNLLQMNSSISEVDEHPILMRTLNEDKTVKNLLQMNSTMRRQDFPKFYKVDGAIAIQKIDDEFNLETSINDGKLGYVIERKYSTDIDNYLDIKIIEYYLEKEKEEEAELMK